MNQDQNMGASSEADQQPQRKRLMLTVGLPRSGKTTWARRQGFPIVCPDTIRTELHGQRFAKEAEPFVWTIANLMVRALFRAGHDRVILDACNNTRKRRDEWKSDLWITELVIMDTPAEKCLERALAEGDSYIIPIIGRMTAESEDPGLDERVVWRRSEC